MDRDLFSDHDFLRDGGAPGRSFDEYAVVKHGAGTNDGDEVEWLHRPPS